MNYLDDIAAAIEREIPRELLPDDDGRTLFRLYALLLLVKDVAVDAEDVHDAWTAWILTRDPGHPAIRPFAELDPEQQAADRPFVEAIRRVAAVRAARTASC